MTSRSKKLNCNFFNSVAITCWFFERQMESGIQGRSQQAPSLLLIFRFNTLKAPQRDQAAAAVKVALVSEASDKSSTQRGFLHDWAFLTVSFHKNGPPKK